jgi:uncharacterized protein (TIGR02266 family)
MDDRVWYIYQGSQQMGPFDSDQVKQLLSSSMISREAYLFKVGWKDWRPIEECEEEIGMEGASKPEQADPVLQKRRDQAPRATIEGRVDVHNDAQFSSGLGVNISASGIFVETKEKVFQVGEHLKLTVRIDGMLKPFNVTAQVIRFNSDAGHPIGYGLRFENISSDIKDDIQKMVDSQDLPRNHSAASL